MSKDPQTWPDFAISLYDHLTGRGAEINYQFEDLEIYVPTSMGPDAAQARWKLNGSLKITTKDSR
jgi:hypothetical protein